MDVLGPLFGFEIGQQVLLPDSTNKWLSRASLMLGHRIRI